MERRVRERFQVFCGRSVLENGRIQSESDRDADSVTSQIVEKHADRERRFFFQRAGFNKKELCDYRRYEIGFVFQFYNLVQNLTAKENVELALQICKDPLDPVFVLKMVGLEDRMNNFPSQLSGGEQQRVAIARAVAKNPKLLLCDEPTGALDYVTGKQVLKVLQDMCYKNGITVVMITHNQALAQMAQKIIRVKSGKIVDIRMNQPVDIEEIEY